MLEEQPEVSFSVVPVASGVTLGDTGVTVGDTAVTEEIIPRGCWRDLRLFAWPMDSRD